MAGRRLKDLTNQKYGRLFVIELDHRESRYVYWHCICDCGNHVVAEGSNITSGRVQSCGCYHHDMCIEKNGKTNAYEFYGDYAVGFCSNGDTFIFDTEDYNLIKDYYWYINNGYVRSRTRNGKTIWLHRLVMRAGDRENTNIDVDHIDHNGKNDRKSNLRIATHGKNMNNSKLRVNNKSGVTGVSWLKIKNRWLAFLNYENKRVVLGTYIDLEDAIKARLQGEKEYLGEYAPQKHLFSKYGI